MKTAPKLLANLLTNYATED